MNENLVETLGEAFDWWSEVSIIPIHIFLALLGGSHSDDELITIFKAIQVVHNRGYLEGAKYMDKMWRE